MIKYNKKIDVIIPAYNVKDIFLFQCLSSIACQNIIDDIEVTIVDDASEVENYQFIADKFKSIMKISIIKRKENGGSGAARQTGIDNTKNEFIVFIDADDTFANSYSLELLRNLLKTNKEVIGVGGFEEIHKSNNDIVINYHLNDLVWLHGKIYRREFINKNNIKFHPTSRANEDNGFNKLCKMCLAEKEIIAYTDNIVYTWRDLNENSITRANNYEYSYSCNKNDSFYGYIENMIYVIQESQKRNIKNLYLKEFTVECMIVIYFYYIIYSNKYSNNKNIYFNYCKEFYNTIFKNLDNTCITQIINNNYYKIMEAFFLEDNNFRKIIPNITFYEFLNQLEDD